MNATVKFQHTSIVLQLEEKHLTLKYSDVLQGLSSESKQTLEQFGDEGWELVSVVPYARGWGDTQAVMAFFKRPS